MLGTGMSLSILARGQYVWVVAILTVSVALLSGSLPAAVLSRMSITRIVKGRLVHGASGTALRKGLVIFQFAACTVLVLGTVVAHRQMEFIRESRLGVSGDEVLVISTYKSGFGGSFEAFRRSLVSRPEIANVATGTPPGSVWIESGTDLDSTGTFDQISIASADEHYVETLGLALRDGRGFEGDPSELEANSAVIINETAARLLQRQDLIGTQFDELAPATIVGIVEDHHFKSLHERIQPLVIAYSRAIRDPILVRLRSDAVTEGLGAVQAVWSDFVPDEPLEYHFLDDQLDEAYRTEMKMSGLLSSFAILMLFVAMLGLFGLAAFSTAQRTKEVAIRKVLGASVSGLVALLSKDFLKLVAVAFVVGAPIAYALMRRWLEDFAYRVELSLMTFILIGTVAVGLSLLTVGVQAARSALADPVKSIRYE